MTFWGGRENSFTNNTIINCDASLTIDARGTWGGSWTTAVETRLDFLGEGYPFYRNVLFQSSFPKLYNIREDHPEWPMYNTPKKHWHMLYCI